MDTKIEGIKNKTAKVRGDVKEKTMGYILTALGLVAGLAWNDAISSFIKYFFPADSNGIVAKFAYAVIVTFIIVVVSNSLLRVFGNKEEA